MAPVLRTTLSTWSTGTNRNSACGSTNVQMSQGHATRSTFTLARVTHFMEPSISVASEPDRGHSGLVQYFGRCETAHSRACSIGAWGGNAARRRFTVGNASILSRHRQNAGYFGYMRLPSSVSPKPYVLGRR